MFYCSHITIRDQTQRILDVFPDIMAKRGIDPSTPIKLYEEIKPGMIDLVKPKSTFHQAEIGDGDILCFQKELSETEYVLRPMLF